MQSDEIIRRGRIIRLLYLTIRDSHFSGESPGRLRHRRCANPADKPLFRVIVTSIYNNGAR